MNTYCKKLTLHILVDGAFMTLLGYMLVFVPQITTYTLALIFSITMVIYGLFKIVKSFITRYLMDNWLLSMFVGLLVVIGGLYLLLNPFFNIIVLTVLVGTYFILECINTTILAVQSKDILRYWWINLFSSAFQFILAIIILAGLTYTAPWTLGLLFGVNLFCFGIVLTVLAFSNKKNVCRL